MITWIILTTVILLLITYWVQQRRKRLNIIKEIGLSGPKPGFLLGNFPEMGQKGLHKCLSDWTDKYGKTFGMYEGSNPIVVTSDVELLKVILIKEFQNFPNRKPFPLDSDHDVYQDMLVARNAKWRRLRNISSPIFSGRRMKEMSPQINNVMDQVMLKLEDHSSSKSSFNIHSIFQTMTLDVIGCCAFGIKVNSVHNPKDVFLHECRKVFQLSDKPNIIFIIMAVCYYIFPSLIKAFRRTFSYIPVPRDWLLARAKDMIEYRKANPSDRVDFIHLMLATQENAIAKDSIGGHDDSSESDSGIDSLPSTPKIAKQTANFPMHNPAKTLTMEEMQGQCFLFIIAGYETTSTALAFVAYELALNPSIQTKMQQEIDEHFADFDEDVRPHYGSVKKLTYMDMVLHETLRLHPIAQLATTRQCSQSITIGKLHLPAGINIQVNMAAVHMDPELWGPEDPKLFVPERFLPERKLHRHPMAYLAFGQGPRQCIGTRFALMEAKIALVRILKTYNIRRCDDTKVPLPINLNAITGPSEGVHIVLEKRYS